MNPWEIVGWIGATCTGVLIILFTYSIARSIIKGPNNPRNTRIL